jgi:nucleoside-diphosphate-sugar epimerase
VHGQDVIYQVAGLVAARSEAEFLTVNRDGTARLVDAASDAGRPHVVLVSSLAAAGPSQPGRRLTGEEEPHPVTAYGRSKLAGERVVRRSSLPWTILRPPAVYGPRDTEMLRVFRAVKLGVAPLFGSGDQELSLVSGPDLGRALAAAGHHAEARGAILYPAHPEVLTSRSLLAGAARAQDKPAPRMISLPRWAAAVALTGTASLARVSRRATLLTRDKAHELYAPARTCDPRALTSLTGWTAEYDFERGAALTVAWYRQAGWL